MENGRGRGKNFFLPFFPDFAIIVSNRFEGENQLWDMSICSALPDVQLRRYCVKPISLILMLHGLPFPFFIGVVWLLILKCILRQPFQKNLKQALLSCWKWILFGAFIKWMAYLTENYALSHGLSYGNIVTQPAQTLFLTLASVLCFKEKLSPRKGFCIFLCIGGVLCISLNGRPLDVFFKENLLLPACLSCPVSVQAAMCFPRKW